jgi:hypothetical protein
VRSKGTQLAFTGIRRDERRRCFIKYYRKSAI